MADLTRPPARCRSCRAPVLWTVLPSNKRMPVDADPHPDGNVLVDHDRYTPSGAHPAVVLGPLELQGGNTILHQSHFVTCPDADEWRNDG